MGLVGGGSEHELVFVKEFLSLIWVVLLFGVKESRGREEFLFKLNWKAEAVALKSLI